MSNDNIQRASNTLLNWKPEVRENFYEYVANRLRISKQEAKKLVLSILYERK